jgi:anti-sigma factor RsiW
MEPDVEQLSCQELVELVTEYLEGTMAAEDRARFEDHVSRCRGCSEYLEQMRSTIRLLGRLSPEAISREAEDALLAAFRNWKAS